MTGRRITFYDSQNGAYGFTVVAAVTVADWIAGVLPR